MDTTTTIDKPKADRRWHIPPGRVSGARVRNAIRRSDYPLHIIQVLAPVDLKPFMEPGGTRLHVSLSQYREILWAAGLSTRHIEDAIAAARREGVA